MPVSVLVPQICMPVEDHQTALPFQVSHYLRHAVLRRYKDVYVGDMLDFKATLTNIGNTSRDCRTEVYKLATPAARVGDTECKPGEMVWFDTPILCTEGNVRLIIKKHLQRGEQADGLVADPWEQLDDFPMTPNVETVVLLSKGEIDSKKVRVEFSLEDMDMSGFQKGATYEQIKAYVLEHTGLKVSSLYISQIKRKCGLDVGQNYNLSKKEDAKVPKCPPEKEAAIRDALKYFQMI